MKRKITASALVIIGILAVLILSCGKKEYKTEIDIANLTLPPSRSFYLGFAYQPYDWSEEAFEKTFKYMNEHGDIVNHYFCEGIPWLEAFERKPYHSNVEEDIQRRLSHIKSEQKVMVGTGPLARDRKSLEKYWAEDGQMERPGPWKDETFDDPDVIKAYLNFCRDLIDRFNPDYFMYAAEVDDVFTNANSQDFKKFLVLVKEVYRVLKNEYPNIPIFMEFALGDDKFMEERNEVRQALLPYTDIYAVSTYPYWFDGIGGWFDNLPKAWFSKIRQFTNKPFAVMETGWLAENFTMDGKLLIIGKEKWQAQYVQFLFEEAQKLDAEFVSWWVSRDYDALWKILEKNDWEEGWKIWRDTGLIDGKGKERLSLKIWDAWLKLPKK